MKNEIEAKFLDIDVKTIRSKLREIGANQVSKEKTMKRKIFDFNSGKLADVGAWVRLRDEGGKITLTYKLLSDKSIYGTQEIEVLVDNFQATEEMLKKLGLEVISSQENKRESWKLDNVELEIDTWPWLPTYLEIEAATESGVKDTAQKLGLSWNEAVFGSVSTIYSSYYSVTEDQFSELKELTFLKKPQIFKI
jgi:adenylate cyclase, class 2